MRSIARATWLGLLAAAASITAAGAGASTGQPAALVRANRPVPVSPGAPGEPTTAGSALPSFSWAGVEGVAGYELVVFDVATLDDRTEPILRVDLPSAATSWTPPLESALAAGREYAWALRAAYRDGVGEWSQPYRFRVPAAPSAEELRRALEVLRSHLAAGERDPRREPAYDALEPRARAVAAARPLREHQPLVTADATGLKAVPGLETGVVLGVHGVTRSSDSGSAGVVGEAIAEGGAANGVVGRTQSAEGAGGSFENAAGGDILRGFSGEELVFQVEKGGAVRAGSFSGDGSGLLKVPVGAHAHDGVYLELGGDVDVGPDRNLDESDLASALDDRYVEHPELDSYAAGLRQASFATDGTFTVPQGVTVLEITAVGGGGSGGSSGSFAGGGGGGSGMVATVPVTVAPGEVLDIDVGWGGGQPGQPRDGGPTIVQSVAGAWRVEVAGGRAGEHAETVSQAQGGAGGAGYFGGGGGAGAPGGAGGAGVIGDGEAGNSFASGAGSSGGAGASSNQIPAAGGGGGPGGGTVVNANELGSPGTQPGAGGSGGSSATGAGHPGAVLIRWVGPPAG